MVRHRWRQQRAGLQQPEDGRPDRGDRGQFLDSAVQAFGAYAQEALPNLWEPDYYYQLSVISNKLHGALPQDPNLNLYPQNWTNLGLAGEQGVASLRRLAPAPRAPSVA